MSDQNPRVVRRPVSTTKIEKWGLVEAWLAQDPRNREITLRIGPTGFATIVRRGDAVHSESINAEDDPASAVLRAIGKLPDAP